METNYQLAVFLAWSENQVMNTYMQEQAAQMAKDLSGLGVIVWEGDYAESLLKSFFPVEANMTIDFDLSEQA